MGYLYKILSKVLVSRLSIVIDKLVSPNQYDFLKDILLVDGVVDMNELVDLVKRRKKIASSLKLTLRKHMILLVDPSLTICSLDLGLLIN